MQQRDDLLVWMDLEMSGLDVRNCYILEIAAVITNRNLDIITEIPAIAVYQDDHILENMDSWCSAVHGKSGLIKRCRESKLVCAQAEEIVLDTISAYVSDNTAPLCGNSVHQDRRFLVKYMPKLESYLNYRLFDVSSFRIAKDIWDIKPNLIFKPKRAHSALVDVLESIDEMRFYREHLL